MGKIINQSNFGNFVIGKGYTKISLTREDMIQLLKEVKEEYFSLLEPSGYVR